ncbi:MAG: ankyrin repeat domain-containing protein [Candidatus Korobacteraceae bacterium]
MRYQSLRRFSALRPLAIPAIVLLTLAWGRPCFCDEIHDAASSGDVAKVAALLKANPELVSSKDNALGDTPLQVAALYNRKEVAELLIANKADVNAKNNRGWTPLDQAAFGGHTDVARLLLANNADVNAKIGPSEPTILCGVDMNSASILNPQRSGALEATLKDGRVVPINCVGLKEALVAFSDAGSANVFAGATPLYLAAYKGFTDTVALLLADNADVNAKNSQGRTPLHIAAIEGYVNVVQLLLANKADVNAQDNDGETPLRCVISQLQLRIKPANPNLKDVEKVLRQRGGHK